jgi:hypothetical protein
MALLLKKKKLDPLVDDPFAGSYCPILFKLDEHNVIFFKI